MTEFPSDPLIIQLQELQYVFLTMLKGHLQAPQFHGVYDMASSHVMQTWLHFSGMTREFGGVSTISVCSESKTNTVVMLR